jgi:hypothetical protein
MRAAQKRARLGAARHAGARVASVQQPVAVAERRADLASRALAQLNLDFRGIPPPPLERSLFTAALLYRRDNEIDARHSRVSKRLPTENGERNRKFKGCGANYFPYTERMCCRFLSP